MKIKAIKIAIGVLGVLVLTVPHYIYAGTLTTPRDYMNRLEENLASGVRHEFFFTTEGAVSGGAGINVVNITFPDGDDDTWCEVNGGLTVAGITDPTGLTGAESASALPGTLAATCTAGVGASSYDTISITGVNDLTATTKYGVRITDTGVADTGTPANTTTGLITITTNNGTTDVDSANTSVDIIADDTVSVSATVQPTITFAVANTSVAFGNLEAGNASFATTAGGADVKTASGNTLAIGTNATSGYVVTYNGATLTSGGDTITVASVTNDDDGTPGSEEFGIGLTTNGDGTIASGYDATSPADYALVASTTTQIFSEAGPTATETLTMYYIANIASNTEAGTYTTAITYTATGQF